MKHVMVKFEQADQMINLVRIINRYAHGADVKYDSRVVDAKFVAGVLSLTKSEAVELILHTDERNELLEELVPFAA